MQSRTIDLELQRLLRTAGWLWLGFLLALFLIDWLMYLAFGSWFYYLVNSGIAIIFIALSYWGGLHRFLRGLYLPLMLVLIAGVPLVLNHLLSAGMRGGNMASPEGMALRQLPVLFVALVIVAWQYKLAGVILFSGFTAVIELIMVIFVAPLFFLITFDAPVPPRFAPISFRTLDVFIFLALVRTVSFIVVGAFLSQLINRLRRQQQSLAEANSRLAHYASTLESLTVSRERNRMAHELHDTLAHSLTALSVQLETVKAYWNVDRKKSRQLLDQSLDATRSGLEETRRALRSLRATPLEELGLAAALRQLAENAVARGGMALSLSLPERLPSLSPDVEQCFYRVAQEALQNVVAHSGARQLSVSLSQAGQAITLEVHDDGNGFDLLQAERSGHYGLLGMRERAEVAGGTLKVDSAQGAGTTITLSIGAAL